MLHPLGRHRSHVASLTGLVLAGTLAMACGTATAPGGGATPPTPAPNSTASAAAGAPATTPPSPTASAEAWGPARVDRLVIPLPPGWSLRPVDPATGREWHYTRLVAFVGTGSSTASCTAVPSGTDCRLDWGLAPGAVSLLVAFGTGPGGREPMWDRVDLGGMHPLKVDGLPALAGPLEPSTEPGRDAEARWELSVPGDTRQAYYLSATYRGPDVEALHALATEVVARIMYEPPVVPLPTGPAGASAAADAAASALGALSDEPEYACFPLAPGTERSAIVTALPEASELGGPRRVICRTDVEATPVETWRLRLSARWEASSERPAGSSVVLLDVLPDGSPGSVRGGVPDEPSPASPGG